MESKSARKKQDHRNRPVLQVDVNLHSPSTLRPVRKNCAAHDIVATGKSTHVFECTPCKTDGLVFVRSEKRFGNWFIGRNDKDDSSSRYVTREGIRETAISFMRPEPFAVSPFAVVRSPYMHPDKKWWEQPVSLLEQGFVLFLCLSAKARMLRMYEASDFTARGLRWNQSVRTCNRPEAKMSGVMSCTVPAFRQRPIDSNSARVFPISRKGIASVEIGKNRTDKFLIRA